MKPQNAVQQPERRVNSEKAGKAIDSTESEEYAAMASLVWWGAFSLIAIFATLVSLYEWLTK